MKRVLFVFLCLFSVPVSASVQLQISDPNTLEPIGLTEVMVGSRVSLVVHSDANDFWSGGLFIKGQDRAIGRLQARGKDPNSRDWAGSHLPASGPHAYVLGWRDSLMWGYDMYPNDFDAQRQSGHWFVIDYHAMKEGVCDVGLYDHGYSWTVPDPNLSLSFLNTPSRDFHADGIVNLQDYLIFSGCWQAEGCTDPNSACYVADLSRNGTVDLEDLGMFADYWLHGAAGWKPAEPREEPDGEPDTIDPNDILDVAYAVVDANALSEITLEVGQSVVLYVTQSSEDDVYIFNTEVTLSDPNLGWIDNDSGTAQILVWPRVDFFDEAGPGTTQAEGIEFLAVNLTAPLTDGQMASFIYTAAAVGDVQLDLIDYASSSDQLESLTIHQVEPVVETLQQIYDESPELQQEISEPEWDEFIEGVEQSQQS